MAYDYVLAGGGSAGATLAARLSEDHKITVCLIEAGGEGRSVVVRAPIGVAAMLSGKPKINNWAFETVPQPGLNGRRGYQPRGKALGGSSAINGMIYIRGHHSDYDDWAALGCDGLVVEGRPAFFQALRKVTSAAPMFFMAATARCASPTSAARGRSRQLLSKPARKTRSVAITISTDRNRRGLVFIRSPSSGAATGTANAARRQPPICIP